MSLKEKNPVKLCRSITGLEDSFLNKKARKFYKSSYDNLKLQFLQRNPHRLTKDWRLPNKFNLITTELLQKGSPLCRLSSTQNELPVGRPRRADRLPATGGDGAKANEATRGNGSMTRADFRHRSLKCHQYVINLQITSWETSFIYKNVISNVTVTWIILMHKLEQEKSIFKVHSCIRGKAQGLKIDLMNKLSLDYGV